MDLLTEIRTTFAKTKKNSAIPLLSLDKENPAWVLRLDDWYGVGIPMKNSLEISERFSNVRLWTKTILIDNTELQLLLLTSSIESLRYEFASVCAQFVDPGQNGAERIKILENPSKWWERWRSLLGNSIHDKAVYSVLGEMMVYEKLLRAGHDPSWTAINKATHDIELEDCSFEIKSTISRYDTTVTINSQFQLQKTGKNLYLVFCRFEESKIGICIADIVERLVSLGVSRKSLDKELEKIGLEVGCSARMEKYKLLEMRKYIVDDSFPSITAKSFKNNKIPESIIQVTYKIDLQNINYHNWAAEEN